MGSMAEDQPLGFFPRSSRSPSCWCAVSRGKPHFDFPWFSLHCEATPAPSFPGLDFFQIGFYPVSFSSHISAPAFRSLRTTSVPRDTTTCASTLHSRIPPALALLTGAKAFRSSSRSSVGSPFQLEALQTEIHRTARAAASPTNSRPASPSPSPRASTPIGAHSQSCSAGHLPALSHPAIPPPRPSSPIRLCARLGCASPVPPGVLTTALLFLSPSILLLPPHVSCFRLVFSSSFQLLCGLLLHSRRSPLPVQPRCRRPDCLKLAPLDCPVRFCNLHCTSRRCMVHDPLSPSGSTVVVYGVVMVPFTMASWAW